MLNIIERNLHPLTSFNTLFEDLFSLTDDYIDKPILGSRVIKTNFKETDKEYIYEYEVPGINKEDIEISTDSGILKLAIENKETNEKYNKREYTKSYQSRMFKLPKNIDLDSIDARLVNGILELKISKKELNNIESRKIEIK